MERELTAAEEAFVAEKLRERQHASPKKARSSSQRRRRSTYTPGWRRLSNWAIAVLLAPFLVIAVFLFALVRVESSLGAGSIDWLSKQKLPPGFNEAASAGGMEWLPQFLAIYSHKELIMGIIFTVAIIIAVLLFMVEVYRNSRRRTRENGKHAEQEDASEEE